MDKIQMATEALEDFKKYKQTDKCRHRIAIIKSLRTIGAVSMAEFADFLPSQERSELDIVTATEIVLSFYAGYINFLDSREFINKYARSFYKKNSDRIKEKALEKYKNDKEYRENHLKKKRDKYNADKAYARERYRHKTQEASFRRKHTEKYKVDLEKNKLKRLLINTIKTDIAK